MLLNSQTFTLKICPKELNLMKNRSQPIVYYQPSVKPSTAVVCCLGCNSGNKVTVNERGELNVKRNAIGSISPCCMRCFLLFRSF